MEWTTKAICMESSRVGEIISACVWSLAASRHCSVAIVNVPVFPVPDCAYSQIEFVVSFHFDLSDFGPLLHLHDEIGSI